jgi:hypothetical protein
MTHQHPQRIFAYNSLFSRSHSLLQVLMAYMQGKNDINRTSSLKFHQLARSGDLTAMLLKNDLLWDDPPCQLINIHVHFQTTVLP